MKSRTQTYWLHLPRKTLTQLTQIWKEWQIKLLIQKEGSLRHTIRYKTGPFHAKVFPIPVMLKFLKESYAVEVRKLLHVCSNLELSGLKWFKQFCYLLEAFKLSSHETHKAKCVLWLAQK